MAIRANKEKKKKKKKEEKEANEEKETKAEKDEGKNTKRRRNGKANDENRKKSAKANLPEIMVKNFKAKLIAKLSKSIPRLSLDLVDEKKQEPIEPFALIFLIQSLRNKVKTLLKEVQGNKINAVLTPVLSRPSVVVGKGSMDWEKMARKKKSIQSQPSVLYFKRCISRHTCLMTKILISYVN